MLYTVEAIVAVARIRSSDRFVVFVVLFFSCRRLNNNNLKTMDKHIFDGLSNLRTLLVSNICTWVRMNFMMLIFAIVVDTWRIMSCRRFLLWQ